MSNVSVRAFRLRDVALLIRLQRQGVSLSPEQALVRSRSALWSALLAPFPWHGIGVATYVLRGWDGRRLAHGVAQMQKRPERPEADLLFLAPALDAHEGAGDIWYRLLGHCGYEAGQFGLQRLFATLPDDAEMLEVFRQACFSLYAKEEIFRLERAFRLEGSPDQGLVRPYREADDWALQRLALAYTPRLVQQAEGMMNGDAPLTRDPGAGLTFVLARGAEVLGAVQIETGTLGYWLRLYGNPQAVGEMRALLLHGLSALAAYPPRPVYCGVRDYQGGARTLLSDLGFRPFATWNRLVRYTVAWAKEPALRATPALERGVEPTMTIGHAGNGRQRERHLPEPAHAGTREPL